MNETFWDAQNLEIEGCANFDDFPDPEKFAVPEKNVDWMLGVFYKNFISPELPKCLHG